MRLYRHHHLEDAELAWACRHDFTMWLILLLWAGVPLEHLQPVYD